MSAHLKKLNIGCAMGNMVINHLLYADDIVLISPSSAGLRKLLAVCEQFGIDNDLLFNASKSAIMVFKSNYMSNFNIPKFYLNGNAISIVEEFKYLGHFICNNLSDKANIERQRKKYMHKVILSSVNSICVHLKPNLLCLIHTAHQCTQCSCGLSILAQLLTNYILLITTH